MNGRIEKISAIVLAAGLSVRMGENKLLLEFNGKPILSHTLDLIASMPFKEKILVTASSTAGGVSLPDSFRLIINREPEKGQSSSMKLGLKEASGEYYMFFLGDMPLIGESLIRLLITQIEYDKIIVPETSGGSANPVIFPKLYRDELMQVAGDTGGRAVMRKHIEWCKKVPVDNAGAFLDVDTPEDYHKIKLI